MTIRSDSYWLTVPITPSIETVGDEKLNTVIPTRNDLGTRAENWAARVSEI